MYDYQKFVQKIMDWYALNKRDHLPWRKNISLYHIHISEVMLQQTQVDRVVGFYNRWLERFPNYTKLAEAPIHDVYEYWKGLGYNSRAKRLWDAAQLLKNLDGQSKNIQFQSTENSENIFTIHAKIPGIGPYTQAAIETFVYNKKLSFIETNIRRVYIHEFFNDTTNVSDADILIHINATLPYINDSRSWYWALMDYGSTLPKVLKYNPNKQSKHYTKQSKFAGSLRQLRAKLLFKIAECNENGISFEELHDAFSLEDQDFIQEALAAIQKDGLIEKGKIVNKNGVQNKVLPDKFFLK